MTLDFAKLRLSLKIINSERMTMHHHTAHTPSEGIMLELRTATQSLHDQTEAGLFNKELVMGRVSREGYADMLGQFLLIHAELESHLRRLHSTIPAFHAVVKDFQYQEPYLREDLEFLGVSAQSIRPLSTTAGFIAEIRQMADGCPIALLGVHYVFEGSNNGSRYISNALRRAYKFQGTDGTRYFDPYGDRQREYWTAFKNDMTALGLSPDERSLIVNAAKKTFVAVMRLHDELQRKHVPQALGASA